MEEAILELLRRLRAISQDHDGLGDTNVRDHMGADVFHGFLKPRAGFEPSGEYGMTPEANRLVAEAIGQFCRAASAAAKAEGLNTFQQRLAAFQSPKFHLEGDVNYNDYFGAREAHRYDEAGNENSSVRKTMPKTVRRGVIFDYAGTLVALLAALHHQKGWMWELTDDDDDPMLRSKPQPGAVVLIREGLECMEPDGSITPPEYGFMALIECAPEEIKRIEDTFRSLLMKVRATNVAEKSDYFW